MANATETKTPTIAATVIREADTNHARGLALTFSNGKSLTIFRADLSDAVYSEALIHGIKQKLVDAAAISRNPETGKSATADDKYEAVKEVYDRLLSGAWNAPREGGGGAGSLLFKALCRMYDTKKPEVLREWLDKKSDAEKAALRKNPKLASIIADIQAEQAKADGINTDELLGELDK